MSLVFIEGSKVEFIMSALGLLEERTVAVAVLDETVTRGRIGIFLEKRERKRIRKE